MMGFMILKKTYAAEFTHFFILYVASQRKRNNILRVKKVLSVATV